MHINTQGVVVDIPFYPSPFQDLRPSGTSISLIVIHSIGLPPGEYGTDCVKQLFLGELDCDSHPAFGDLRGMRVSAHIFIRRDGSLMQFVPFERRAWHAGKSCYKGVANCNDFSIGMELEGARDDDYTDVQYQQLTTLCNLLIKQFPNIEDMVGHKDIAGRNEDGSLRKDDPWNFDWNRFRHELSH